MPVNQNIRKFYNVATERDFSRDFLFRVTGLQLPGLPPLLEDELVYVKAAKLPGRSITNQTASYMGLKFNIPGTVQYDSSENYSLEFFLDAQCELRAYFEAASRSLFDDSTSTGGYSTPNSDSYIILEQLDKQLNPVAANLGKYKLHGASIRKISEIDYKISDGTGATVPINVTFSYHYYTVGDAQ